jgi:hypothetical protein
MIFLLFFQEKENTMSNTINTQLISATNYDVSNIEFSTPQVGSVPGGGPAISFSRINISTRNPDGTSGELVMSTERLFSFGVSENTNPDTGKVNGWTMPLCLWNRDGPTSAEKCWTDTFDKIVEKCIDHLIENKEELDKFDLERSDLKKFNPLYWKKVKGVVNGKPQLVVAEGTGPTLYSKLIYGKKNEKFVTNFFDIDNNPIDPLEMLGKYCYAKAAIKIESIFIGNKISLQVKLYEVEVEPVQTGMKRLLRPEATSKVIEASRTTTSTAAAVMDDDDESDDDGSIDDDSVHTPAPAPAPTPVKKAVPRKINKK